MCHPRYAEKADIRSLPIGGEHDYSGTSALSLPATGSAKAGNEKIVRGLKAAGLEQVDPIRKENTAAPKEGSLTRGETRPRPLTGASNKLLTQGSFPTRVAFASNYTISCIKTLTIIRPGVRCWIGSNIWNMENGAQHG